MSEGDFEDDLAHQLANRPDRQRQGPIDDLIDGGTPG
jgi:hypothetical protein